MTARLHPVVERAAAGELPSWSSPSANRLAHMERVAHLMSAWAEKLGHAAEECMRWRAAGLLHDTLREVAPDTLRPLVPPALQDLPGKLLHGPAAATRLRDEGVEDEPFLRAIAYHTLGHQALDELGRALFIADYIEPGRSYDTDRLDAWRRRMPAGHHSVLREVLRARIDRLLNESRPIRPETASFWNLLCTSDGKPGTS